MTTSTPIQLFRKSLFDHFPAYLFGTVAMGIVSASEAAMPKFIQWTIDTLTPGSQLTKQIPRLFARPTPEATLNMLVLGFLATLVIGWFGRLSWRQTLARRTHVEGYFYKNRFWNALRHQPLNFFHTYPLGDLMNRGTSDINRVRAIHGFSLVMTYDVIFFTTLSAIGMFFIDVQLTLLTFLVVPFLPRTMNKINRLEYSLHLRAQRKLSKLSDVIVQTLSTIRLQRATASEDLWQQSMQREAESYAQKRIVMLRTGWKIYPLSAVPVLAAYLLLLTLGVYKISTGTLTIGGFVAFQSYVLLLQGPLSELGEVLAEWQTGFASFARVVEILNLKVTPRHNKEATGTEKSAPHPTWAASGESLIDIQNLSLKYPGAALSALKEVSLKIKAGEKIGITGPIGAGKSTLLGVLAGISTGYEGTVKIKDQLLPDFSNEERTGLITVIPQKSFLFAGSIRDNLVLDAAYTDDMLWDALTSVQLADDVRLMPAGLDSWIGEGGLNLSGGQKQRLAIARALLRKTDIILLDDCLSAVDAVTEEKILRAFETHFARQTVIWVAHRKSTLALCSRIIHMDEGLITEIESR
jgi:ATP-binding cassette subfamily B protein